MSGRKLLIEVPAGDLIDKITILEIKRDRIAEPDKRRNVEAEYAALTEARESTFAPSPRLTQLTADLKAVNERLWELEDKIRRCEAEHDFGRDFIDCARAIYASNDERARLKRAINEHLGSRLVEEKSYGESV